MNADRPLRFAKMHGAGNDYVYVAARDGPLPDDLPGLARALSHRNAGVGGDGLILVLPPEAGGDVRMRMFNADGSEGRMCGNGVRCVAKLAADRGLVPADAQAVVVETASGPRRVGLLRDDHGRVVGGRVDMGRPELGPAAVGLVGDPPAEAGQLTFVSMGNPHAVAFVDDLAAIDLPRLGPLVATNPAFAEGINAHFVQILAPDRLRIAHWERGSGPTLACGTGACAACVAGVVTGRTDRRVAAEVPGGVLELDWRDDGGVTMAGPAVEVFRGEWVG